MGRSGREADQERHDRNGKADGALPDVDRPEPAAAQTVETVASETEMLDE